MKQKQIIPYLVVVVPLVLVLSVSFFISNTHMNKMQNQFRETKENSIKEYIELKKTQSELQANELILLFESSNNQLKPEIQKELIRAVDLAYDAAQTTYKKYQNIKNQKEITALIKELLSQFSFKDKDVGVFIKDHKGNKLLHIEQERINKQHRNIGLEEIQKVRRFHEGFIEYVDLLHVEKIVYVKNLDIYDLYIGVTYSIEVQKEFLKADLLKNIHKFVRDEEDFLGIFNQKERVYLSKEFELKKISLSEEGSWHQVENHFYYYKYFVDFDWYVLYGFDTKSIRAKAELEKEKSEKILEDELNEMFLISTIAFVIVLFLSVLLSLKINTRYKNEAE